MGRRVDVLSAYTAALQNGSYFDSPLPPRGVARGFKWLDSINNFQRVEKLLYRTTTISLNDSFDFELVPQNEEDIRLRSKLNDKAK